MRRPDKRENRVRQKTNFANGFNWITVTRLPDKNISLSFFQKS
jgi:hypothetical protein